MKLTQIIETVEKGFIDKYYNFKELQQEEKYKPMWEMCINTLKTRDLLINIIFCNDVYQIPPVRVFIDINRVELERLMLADREGIFFENGQMKNFIKQSVGAFWGMVFRFALAYDERKTVAVVKEKNYGIQSASRFIKLQGTERNYCNIE